MSPISLELLVRKDGYVQCTLVIQPDEKPKSKTARVALTGVKRFRTIICDKKEHEVFKGLRGGRYSVYKGCKNYAIPKKKGTQEETADQTQDQILKRIRECSL